MLQESEAKAARRHLLNAGMIPFVLTTLMVLVYVLATGLDYNVSFLGIYPRHVYSLWNVLTVVFIHGSWGHLFNNILSFFVLSVFLFYFYPRIALSVFLYAYFLSGLGLWLIGRESCHVGASGMIYSLAFFLFFSGFLRNYSPLIAVSLIVTLVYGNMIWHVFPWEVHDPVSWEGHLSGGVVGVVLSFFYRHSPPQKPVIIWENDEEDEVETGEKALSADIHVAEESGRSVADNNP